MRKLLMVILVPLAFCGVAQEIKVVKLEELNAIINTKDDRLKVINFWASWCGPCVKEMPYFDELGQQGDFDLYFVSLDFSSQVDKAARMLEKKGIKSKALLLDEKDADKYISDINNDWSGAIPATLFVQPSGQKTFYEKALEKDELENIVKNLTSK